MFVASPADAEGRGISLVVRENGAACDLTYLCLEDTYEHMIPTLRDTWRHSAAFAHYSLVLPNLYSKITTCGTAKSNAENRLLSLI